MSVSVPEKESDMGGGEQWAGPGSAIDTNQQLLNLQNALAMSRAELRALKGSTELYRSALFACLKVLENQIINGAEP